MKRGYHLIQVALYHMCQVSPCVQLSNVQRTSNVLDALFLTPCKIGHGVKLSGGTVVYNNGCYITYRLYKLGIALDSDNILVQYWL